MSVSSDSKGQNNQIMHFSDEKNYRTKCNICQENVSFLDLKIASIFNNSLEEADKQYSPFKES